MKPTAYLLNTSRGGLGGRTRIDRCPAARPDRRGGLDVLEQEPPALDHPLLQMDNVIITGHTAGSTVESIHALVDEWLRIIDAYRAGGPPINLVKVRTQVAP